MTSLSSEQLPPEDILAVLQEEARKRRRRRQIGRGIVFSYLGLSAVTLAAVIAYGIVTEKWELVQAWFAYVTSFGGVFGLLGLAAAGKAERKAARDAAKLDDVRFVGPLLEALHFQDYRLKQDVIEALINLLPRLSVADWQLLTEDQQMCLYRALKVRDNKLQFEAIALIERVRDSRALPFVRQLLEPNLEFFLYPSVERAAINCISSLEQVAESERASGKLLRASDSPIDVEKLLKPASAHSDTDETQLLRASVQE